MKLFRRIFHPLITFIGIQLLWIFLLVSWIYWFLGRHQQLKELADRYQAEWLPDTTDWFILAEGIVLLVAILIGTYVIFIFWRRQSSLNRAQRHFINQVTHELKSPLASIQLHLDTIEMRQPEGEKLQDFVKLMQTDTERLGGLINNLLTAGKLEHKDSNLNRQYGNLSRTVEEYLQHKQPFFQTGNEKLEWKIEPGLMVNFDKDLIETVLRNLLENAVLYADGPPSVTVKLHRDGRLAHLSLADQGRGIDPKYSKKVFKMFYRIRRADRTVRGSGLGLFIVRNAIRRHGGKVWLKSAGPGFGSTFHLTLPLARKEQ
ncbi:HAMP domain-containing sensor histidine kinase [Malonomonas rubra]|uniref:sensor histidine kinase n=1 Tax=Malonomonas rubra TaxID=57040 RepID=UPI0026F1236E|nr:HAMP domain-containing sensor histidine kinase [Malonomonas rubra]